MSKRTKIAGTVLARNAAGEVLEHSYVAEHTDPVYDQLGTMSFDWTGSIDGGGSQPTSRLTTIRAVGGATACMEVQRRIEKAIVEHLKSREFDHADALQ